MRPLQHCSPGRYAIPKRSATEVARLSTQKVGWTSHAPQLKRAIQWSLRPWCPRATVPGSRMSEVFVAYSSAILSRTAACFSILAIALDRWRAVAARSSVSTATWASRTAVGEHRSGKWSPSAPAWAPPEARAWTSALSGAVVPLAHHVLQCVPDEPQWMNGGDRW